MLAYHVDRLKIAPFQKGDLIVLNKNFRLIEKETEEMVKKKFPGGITNHGQRYLTNAINPNDPFSYLYETIFEHERSINFQDCPSRFQCHFALESLEDYQTWIHIFNKDARIWKVQVDPNTTFRADAAWFKFGDYGTSIASITNQARKYWSGEFRDDIPQEPELLINGPMKIVDQLYLF